ncbi:MAG: hypothetical protein HY079_10875 [Elusimicrobia bacterium]|nr:hypothetical protein [Elusimicrobiota bacterium]
MTRAFSRRVRSLAGLLAGLAALSPAALAQVRGRAVEAPALLPPAAAVVAPAAGPLATAPLGLSALSAPSAFSAPAAFAAAPSAPALAALPAAAAGPQAAPPAALAPAAAPAPAEDKLWDGGMPASDARKMLRAAHWETTKFFFTSRVKLLREMIEQQKAESAGKVRAVADLEKMWLDWRVQAYSGRVTTAGFQVADRATIRKDALKFFDRHWGRDEASRAAFRRYMDRVDATVPLARPSNYRKHAYAAPFDLAGLPSSEVPAKLDSLLTGAHVDEIAFHRAHRQDALRAAFEAAALAAIREVNASLPKGKRVVSVIMLGSYAIDQSTPKSDIDYQLMTEDGSSAAIAPFNAALDRNWKEDRIEKLESFQFALPPSREVVVESFLEGYRVISPDPAVVAALSKDSFAPKPVTGWSRLRGKAFGAFYRAWCWTYLRLADFADLLKLPSRK